MNLGDNTAQVLTPSYAYVAGVDGLITTAGTYLILAAFDFYYSDSDIANKRTVIMDGYIATNGAGAGGSYANLYAPIAQDTRCTVNTQVVATCGAFTNVNLLARAYPDDGGSFVANRAFVYTGNSTVVMFRLA